ncbi:MAG: copper ion binding protein [Clostridiales bacterium]|jgi:copper chaperone|nr:copper ion binding protein [Clostridiales bacterium]
MAKQAITLKVGGMSCEHCVKAITKAVGAIEGVSSVKVNLGKGEAAIKYDESRAALDAIKEAIIEEGYEVTA